MMALGLALISALTGDIDLKEVQRVISRNEETLSRIQTVRATIEVRESKDDGRTWKQLGIAKVIRSGRREKIFDTIFGSSFGGEWREGKGFSTVLFDPSECRSLGEYDPESPPREPLSEEDVDRVRGAFLVAPSYGPQGWSHRWKAQVMLMAPGNSFRDLLNEFSAHSYRKGSDARGNPTWELELQRKEKKTGDHIQSYRFSFSPRHEYLVTGQEVAGVSENKSVNSKADVLDFWDFGSGLVLPKLIRATASKMPGRVVEIEMKNVEVNQPVGDQELTLEFPRGAIVIDHRNMKYHLWGEGAPARTFASNDEFNAWNQQRQRKLFSKSMKRGQFPFVAAGIALLTAIALVALVMLRRKLASAST